MWRRAVFTRAAKGCYLWDVDDNMMIDFVGTWGPAILGHAPKVVIEAVHEAAKRGVSFGTPNPLEVEMAKVLVDWVPSIEKVRMVNSGTEATMSAIRLARGFTGRDKIIKFEGCYHGHVDSLLVAAGSGALTHGEPDSAGIPKSFAAETIALPFNDPGKVEAAFAAAGDQIAAVILEPIPANAGLFFPQDGFLEFLRDITTKHGALLIFDEVMDRFPRGEGRRAGAVWGDARPHRAGENHRWRLPVGAFGGRADVMDQLAPQGPVYQAGTLSGNPLAMAAGAGEPPGGWRNSAAGTSWSRSVSTSKPACARPWPRRAKTLPSTGSDRCLPIFLGQTSHRPRFGDVRGQGIVRQVLPRLPRSRGVYFALRPTRRGSSASRIRPTISTRRSRWWERRCSVCKSN